MSAGLNPSQAAAVEHDRGPLLVLAGAGSGKTRVITMRIQRLLARGVKPQAILAVSFTNKAAEEMRERMVPLVGPKVAEQLELSTFHSFGVRFLQEENKNLGYDGKFVIFDQADALGLVKQLMREAGLANDQRKLDANAIVARISRWKNELKAPSEIPESDFEYDAVARQLYPQYEAQLRNMHAVDFDDLVVLPVRILEKFPRVREKWQLRFRYILIDEFQDTNVGQLQTLLLLANEQRNVCVVGDDDQSIYSFRGADVRNILEFEAHFPGAKIIKLEDNYRSKAPVLEVANAAIAQSAHKRHGKTLRAARGAGDKVRIVQCVDPGHEARFVTEEIRSRAKDDRVPYRDMAILYRSNLQAKLIEDELRSAGVPYRLFGGQQFFDRKEVKDAAAYLRCVVNPRDDISLRRIINYPPRGIGDTTVERLNRFRLARDVSLGEAVNRVWDLDDIPDNAKRSARQLTEAIAKTRQKFDTGQGLRQSSLELFEAVGLKAALMDASDPQGARRWENIEFLLRSIERFEGRPSADRPTLAQFLARITLRKDDKNEDEEQAEPNQVTLSTLHGAKGLEFHTVFLIGCVEGQLPHTRITDPKITEAAPSDVEEERRLFYVGVTRAKDRLYMSHFKRRMLRGKVMECAVTRFFEGLPEHATEPYSRVDRPALDTEEMADLAGALLAKLRAR
ncbi:MAG TPA: UvrD-helicase domain-containing protein [Polyangiales bacterium]|nr:UvrD-helicase domain-containing protein [Polyangiales bacterium]